jgi:mediator of RNA polymerase II transcription subunit 25
LLLICDYFSLTGGKSESNANLAEGLATALVCFHDLENIRDKDAVVNKHCILITNSSPYSMHVTECFEYEGKTVEQLASIFLEKNINLSIISPRKIPVLYELFEKSGGDLGATASKNYSKDPRHLVLLKGFSLKERPASPNVNPAPQAGNQQNVQQTNPPQQAQQNPQQQQQQQQQQSNQQENIGGGMINQNTQIRPPMVQVRANNPQNMMQNQQQGMGMAGNQFGNAPMNFPNRPQNPQQQNQNPMWNANQPRAQFINNQQNNMMAGQMQGNLMQQQQNQNQQPANSALISQLSQPPSLPPQMAGNQQGNMVRMNPMQGQQQNPMQMQGQQVQNPNINMANLQGNQMMQQGQVPPQMNPGQMNMMQQPSTQQQQGPMPTSECIWRGILEWNDKQNQQNTMRQVQCEVHSSFSKETKEVEVRGDNWPTKLIMQLMPRQVITNVGGHRLRESKIVIFQWGQPSEAFQALTKVMANGFAGCVHFNANQCDLKILILLYMPEKKSYYGFIPNDQVGYVEELRRIIQMSKIGQNVQNPGNVGIRQMNPAGMGMNPMNNQGNAPMNAQQQMGGGNMQPQGDQNQMMFNQMQMQGNNPGMVGNVMMQQNQQRMQRPPMMQNNLRHLLQQVGIIAILKCEFD